MNLTVTLILLGTLLSLLGLCIWQERKPRVIGDVRMIPYRFVALMLLIMSFATLAHAVSLATGKPVVPRTGKFGTR